MARDIPRIPKSASQEDIWEHYKREVLPVLDEAIDRMARRRMELATRATKR